MSGSSPDLLIVGGGLIGLSLANVAARRELKVTVLERERVGARASWAGAGMLNCRPWPRRARADYHDLVRASAALHAQWAERLKDESGLDVGYRRCGSLELFCSARIRTSGFKDLERLLAGCRERDVPAERLDRAAALALERELNVTDLAAALHFPADAQVRPPRLCRALALSCRQWGVEVREGVEAADVWVEGRAARGVILRDGSRLPAGRVAVCAGAWTARLPALVRAVPRSAKIEPVRGQILCYHAPQGLFTRLLTDGHRYLVPRPDGVVLAGSTMERVGFEAVTTPEGQAGLRGFAENLVPALRKLAPAQGWADLRPGLKGPHPILGPVPDLENLYLAAGHFRNGIVLAPLTAELLTALILGEPPPLPLEPWRPRGPGEPRAGGRPADRLESQGEEPETLNPAEETP